MPIYAHFLMPGELPMKPDTISLNLLVDESCFMQQHGGEIFEVLVRFMDEYRQRQTTVSCSVFAEQFRNVFTDTPINDVQIPAIKPMGQSALIESACRLIDEIGNRLTATPEEDRPEQVIVAIFTAGQPKRYDIEADLTVLVPLPPILAFAVRNSACSS